MPMPHPEKPPLPPVIDSDNPFTDDERATLHRMIHQVDHLYRVMAPFLPVAEAYLRGGKLAANTALKRLRP